MIPTNDSMMFWARELRPGQVATLYAPSQRLVLCGGTILGNATIDGWSERATRTSQLLVTLKSGSISHVDFPICSFVPGKIEFVQLNVTIPLSDRVKLESRGDHTIFLYGNIIGNVAPDQQNARPKRGLDLDDNVKNKRQKTGSSAAEDLGRPATMVPRETFIRRTSPEKNSIGKAASEQLSGRSEVVRLSDPTASRQLGKISAFDVETSDLPPSTVDKGKRREDAHTNYVEDSTDTAAASTSHVITESDSEVMEVIGDGQIQKFVLWINNQEVEITEFSAGVGEPCGMGSLVTIEYMARNQDTSEFFWDLENPVPETKSFTFTIGDKDVPGVLNGGVNGAKLQAERTVVIPRGMLDGKAEWPFPTNVNILFEFIVTDITRKVKAEGGSQKPVAGPSKR